MAARTRRLVTAAILIGASIGPVVTAERASAAGSFTVDHTVATTGAIATTLSECGFNIGVNATLVAKAPHTQVVQTGDPIDLRFRFTPPLVVSHRHTAFSVETRLDPPAVEVFGGNAFTPASIDLVGTNLAAAHTATAHAGDLSAEQAAPGLEPIQAVTVSTSGGPADLLANPAVDGTISEVRSVFTVPGGLPTYGDIAPSMVEATVRVSLRGTCPDDTRPVLFPQPTPCTAGFYNGGGTACVPADPGYYVPSAGATAQLPCMRGYFQTDSGATGCDPAPPGTFVDAIAASAATLCVPGTYQPLAAMTGCVLAEPGYSVPSSGARTPTPCPSGYTSDAGATACRPLDSSAPTITITTPANGGDYLLGAAVDAAYACVDETGGSGVATCAGTVANGSAIGTSTIGTQTFDASTSDVAGNTASAAASFKVVYGFSGFRAPVDAAPVVNAAKAGQTVPLKFLVTDAAGAPITTLTSVSVTVASLACSAGSSVDPIEEYSAGGTGLQHLGGGEYQFNWKTPKSYASSCKTMKLDLGDGVARTALFSFK